MFKDVHPGKRQHIVSCTTDDGTRVWFNDFQQLHREDDLPAMITADGTQHWFQNGKRYRVNNLPTSECPDGTKIWHDADGEIHRSDDNPAIIRGNGTLEWYLHGTRHRDNDLPAIITDDGDMYWWKTGKPHRDGDLHNCQMRNGSKRWYEDENTYRVVHANGIQEWRTNGKTHRGRKHDNPNLDQPAIIHPNGRLEFWTHGRLDRVDHPGVLLETYSNGVIERRWRWDGLKEHFVDGKLNDLRGEPARILRDGTWEYYTNGEKTKAIYRISVDFDARYLHQNHRHTEYFEKGVLHREGDQPAVDIPGYKKEWWKHGKRHREDGKPAVEMEHGYKEYWVDGVMIIAIPGGTVYFKDGKPSSCSSALGHHVYFDQDMNPWSMDAHSKNP